MDYSHILSSAVKGGTISYSSATSSPVTNPSSEIGNLLAGAGYQVRISDLQQVAEQLEILDSAMVNSPFDLSDDLIHYNPSDLSSWLQSLLPESDHNNPTLLPGSGYPITRPLTLVSADVEEDSGIRLVHLLMTCAESIQRGDLPLAASVLDEMNLLLKLMNTTSGIGKVAGYFIDALSHRLYHSSPPTTNCFEHEILYHHFYEACPYLKFAHFTANQAILEAFNGHDRVHVIDFDLMHGLQWPPLIQALALRPGGPPSFTLTSIGPRSPNGSDVGLKLGQLARSVNVPFTFHVDVLHVEADEVVAINSVMQLHRLLGLGSGPITSFLEWIKSLRPKIVTVVEQEANHNRTRFLDRFTEALHYYSTLFDSLEASQVQPEKALAEMYIQKEIRNILCCEGPERVERHESLTSWKARLHRAGFRALHLGSKAFKQASMLLTLFSAEGYCVEENDGCLTLGWHSRPLIAASAWQVVPFDGPN